MFASCRRGSDQIDASDTATCEQTHQGRIGTTAHAQTRKLVPSTSSQSKSRHQTGHPSTLKELMVRKPFTIQEQSFRRPMANHAKDQGTK